MLYFILAVGLITGFSVGHAHGKRSMDKELRFMRCRTRSVELRFLKKTCESCKQS
jgi:hypothetical protein